MTLASVQLREVALQACQSLAAAEQDASSSDSAEPLSIVLDRLTNDRLQGVVSHAAALRAEADRVLSAGAGVLAKRSERALGFSGLAAQQGHRSAAELLQAITGSSKSEAARQVRLGEAMGEADAAVAMVGTADEAHRLSDESGAPEPSDRSVVLPWFEPVTRAVAEHGLSPEGAAALLRGFGEANEHCPPEVLRTAAIGVLAEIVELSAAGVRMNVDELTKLARRARDRVDPVGVSERFERRYTERSWRFSRSASGARTAWVQFDDESAAWVDGIVSAGMRPRRGGPRFVDPAQAERARDLLEDPRTNEQMVFDLLMDTLRAGAVADPTIAYGNRQPGVRVIVTKESLSTTDAAAEPAACGFLEETGEAVPGSMVERLMCAVGYRQITVDGQGNPLDVGREQRLFTTKQRIALAYRDGGCMAPGCDMPASYCEAHHADEWDADHGRTDIADGLLLCRFHHMLIHNQHWKIRRDGTAYWLIPPPGHPDQNPIRLQSKAAWRQSRAG